jgi:membrane protein required for beta-lactamase induction
MTTDARNSVNLWLGAIIFVGGAFLSVGFLDGLAANVPSRWFWVATVLLGAVDIARFAQGLWQRRASNSGNPNPS